MDPLGAPNASRPHHLEARLVVHQRDARLTSGFARHQRGTGVFIFGTNQRFSGSKIADIWVFPKISQNSGTPKSSILIGISIINHPFWGTPIFGNTHISPTPPFLAATKQTLLCCLAAGLPNLGRIRFSLRNPMGTKGSFFSNQNLRLPK